GATWSNVAPNVPGLPGPTWVSSVQASRYAKGTAYVTFDGHRRGDMAPHVYKTTDFGATWESLATPELDGYAHVVREDSTRPDLLFLGTESGLFISLDGGKGWARFKGNLPKVAVCDIAIQEREGDLVFATHGRGIYIIDDLSPIRAMTPQTLESKVAMLPARPAEMPIEGVSWPFVGDDDFVGDNPREEAVITYWLKRRHLMGDLKVEVFDSDGKLLTTLPGGKRVGINRVAWPMRLKPPKVPPATTLVPAFVGPRVPEGTYKVKLIKGQTTLEGQVTLVADPRSPHSAEDRALQQKTALALYDDLGRLTYTVDAIADARDQLRERAQNVKKHRRLATRLTKLADSLEAMRKKLVATRKGQITGEEKLREKLGELYGAVSRYDGRPTDSQLERQAILEKQLKDAEGRLKATVDGELAEVNAQLEKREVKPVSVLSRQEWDSRQEKVGGTAAEAGEQATALSGLANAVRSVSLGF
ncbi:MAG: glycosyl hydrolase, partial [Acidobacteria bacterium]|nr:glycosyl hydrolase [Acidobacteriota bacterium]